MKILGKIGIVVVFVIGYLIFAGSIDSHFWVPFILVVVVTMGWGNVHLWGEKKSEKENVKSN